MIQKILKWIFQKYNGCFYIGKSDVLPPPLSKEEDHNARRLNIYSTVTDLARFLGLSISQPLPSAT